MFILSVTSSRPRATATVVHAGREQSVEDGVKNHFTNRPAGKPEKNERVIVKRAQIGDTMARLTLTLLGGFRARLEGGAPVALPTRKAQALLAYLAVPAGLAHPRDKLASLLWGSTVETTARTSLRQTLYALRKSLAGADRQALRVDGETVTLDPAAVTVDVAEFEQLVAEGTPTALAEAAGLCQGELLDGLSIPEPPFEDWLQAQRERLREAALRALGRLLGHQRAARSTDPAVQTALRLLALDPLQESVHRALMQLYVETGRRGAALRQYQLCVDSLQRELKAKPEKETTALYEEILHHRPRTASRREGDPVDVAETTVASPRALEEERKQVTVLFADLKGSMEMLADRDPEDARKLLDPVLERMMAAVHRYEGTVNQVMGDGIMALFGAPRAHEDHAVRACYAALRMHALVQQYAEQARQRHGVNVRIQVGLDSGEVVVRAIGSDLRMDYTAVGQTTHLAARMQQAARPGSTLLTRSTLNLVEGYVTVKPLGPISVKGMTDTMEAYELTGAGPARTRFQASIPRGLTRFVGRDVELAQLRHAQQLAGDGHGQVASIVGEPGVGKSRLVHEFIHSQRLQDWQILEGGAVSYGKAISYLPVIALLKSYFKVEDRDDLGQVREKVTGRLLTLDRALQPILPALLALLDVPVDDPSWPTLSPGQRRQRTLDAVRRLLLRQAHEQPLLLIFEDLHWIDGESQALLDGLVDSVGSARVLLIVNYRPEYQHVWGSKTYYSQLRLDMLPVESAGKMLDTLLGDDPGLAPLKERLVRRGNPAFLEETVRILAETKALAGERGQYRLTRSIQAIQVSATLSATVQAVLSARIDRLPPEDKRLLQVASVIGKDMPFALLQAIADLPDEALRAGLESLQSAEFLYETGLYPEIAYSFKHALTHEVTYGGLLRERRRALHARIVDAIETLHRDRLGGEIERLAHHAQRGELREKAVQYLRQAGAKAATRSAFHDARVWLEQALEVVEALPESPSVLEQAFEIRLELRPVLNLLGEPRQALERLREAEALANRLNDDLRRGQVRASMTNLHSLLGEMDEAVVTGTYGLEVARRLGDLRLGILATTYLEQAHYFRGEYERVIELATGNLSALPAEWTYEYFGATVPPSVYDRSWLVLSLAQLGRFAEAATYAAEAIRIAEPTQHANTVGLAYRNAGILHLLKGDWAQARSLSEHGVAVFRTGNVVSQLPSALASWAWALAQLGEASEALNQIRLGEQVVERLTTTGFVGHLAFVHHALGHAALRLGRLDDARRLVDGAVAFAPRHTGFTAHAQHLLGEIATHPDRFDAQAGEDHYRTALNLAAPRGMRPLVAHCHLGLGTLYYKTGKQDQAREHLTTARTMYGEMDMPFWLARAAAAV
jgi:class 3 adenylate cyclase/two-component SAPR family response regulator/tetratricopeptide (TPR) repeat protein